MAAAEGDTSQRLEDVKNEISTLNQSLSETKDERDNVQSQLKAQSQIISELHKELRTTRHQVAEQESKLNTLRDAMGVKKASQQAQLSALYEQIRAAYINAEPGFLELLLNQNDLAALSRSSTYFRYFHEARNDQLTSLASQLASLNEEQGELLLAQQQWHTLLKQQEAKQTAMSQEKVAREQLLATLDASLSTQENKLAVLEEQAQSLQKLLNELSSRKSVTTKKQADAPFSSFKRLLLWPVNGKVTARYGSKRNIGTLKWQGIVIDAKAGKDVKATAAGEVVFADWLRGFGLLMIVDHGEEYMTLYGNNESLFKQAGDHVEMGEIIAQSGEQGIRGISGLYFELRHKGNPTNPLNWLKKKS
jgi:septal ring factor EnvC (AmiA/AmiB activator)